MRYRFYGDEFQLVRYEIKYHEPWDAGGEPRIQTAVDEAERDELLKLYPEAEATDIDNSGYEWLDGMIFTQEQLRAGELEKAIELGEKEYKRQKEESNSEYRVSVLEEALLEIASIIGGE